MSLPNDPDPKLSDYAHPEKLVTNLALRLYQTPATPKQAETFLAYLKSRAADRGDETVRRLLHLMMSTPQFQLT